MMSIRVASIPSICVRRTVVETLTLSTRVTIFGRSSVIMDCASSAAGRTLVFTSSASDSIFALVLRMAMNMPTRIPACSRTAHAVTTTKIVRTVLSIDLSSPRFEAKRFLHRPYQRQQSSRDRLAARLQPRNESVPSARCKPLCLFPPIAQPDRARPSHAYAQSRGLLQLWPSRFHEFRCRIEERTKFQLPLQCPAPPGTTTPHRHHSAPT